MISNRLLGLIRKYHHGQLRRLVSTPASLVRNATSLVGIAASLVAELRRLVRMLWSLVSMLAKLVGMLRRLKGLRGKKFAGGMLMMMSTPPAGNSDLGYFTTASEKDRLAEALLTFLMRGVKLRAAAFRGLSAAASVSGRFKDG